MTPTEVTFKTTIKDEAILDPEDVRVIDALARKLGAAGLIKVCSSHERLRKMLTVVHAQAARAMSALSIIGVTVPDLLPHDGRSLGPDELGSDDAATYCGLTREKFFKLVRNLNIPKQTFRHGQGVKFIFDKKDLEVLKQYAGTIQHPGDAFTSAVEEAFAHMPSRFTRKELFDQVCQDHPEVDMSRRQVHKALDYLRRNGLLRTAIRSHRADGCLYQKCAKAFHKTPTLPEVPVNHSPTNDQPVWYFLRKVFEERPGEWRLSDLDKAIVSAGWKSMGNMRARRKTICRALRTLGAVPTERGVWKFIPGGKATR